MTLSLILAFIWIVVANVIAIVPKKNGRWPEAYVLIAVGVPLLGYVTYENGPWVGLVALVAGASILRWPLRYFGRWVRRVASRNPK